MLKTINRGMLLTKPGVPVEFRSAKRIEEKLLAMSLSTNAASDLPPLRRKFMPAPPTQAKIQPQRSALWKLIRRSRWCKTKPFQHSSIVASVPPKIDRVFDSGIQPLFGKS